jgi:hypothetical protein
VSSVLCFFFFRFLIHLILLSRFSLSLCLFTSPTSCIRAPIEFNSSAYLVRGILRVTAFHRFYLLTPPSPAFLLLHCFCHSRQGGGVLMAWNATQTAEEWSMEQSRERETWRCVRVTL